MDDVIYSRPLGGGARPGRETVLISSGRLLTDLYGLPQSAGFTEVFQLRSHSHSCRIKYAGVHPAILDTGGGGGQGPRKVTSKKK